MQPEVVHVIVTEIIPTHTHLNSLFDAGNYIQYYRESNVAGLRPFMVT